MKKPKSLKNRTTFKADPTKRKSGTFTQIPYSILNNPNLPPIAKVLLIQILSDADGFTLSPSMYARRNGVTIKTIYSALRELEEAGYLRRTPINEAIAGYRNESSEKKLYHYTISEFGNLLPVPSDHVPGEHDPGTEVNECESCNAEMNEALLQDYMLTIIQYFDFSEVEVSFTRLHKKHSQELGHIDFYPFRNAMNKVIDQFRKDIYTGCMNVTEKDRLASRKAITAYSNWLKDEVFNKMSIPTDYEKKWMHFKLKYTHYSTDFETEAADRREQEYYDGF